MSSKFCRLVVALAAAVGFVEAASSAASCQNYQIPVCITSNNLNYTVPHFVDNFDVADLITKTGTRGPPSDPFSGNITANATYMIGATFCSPVNATKNNTVLLATHGLGFDRSYWDFPLHPENYSFVDHAIGAGYSVFFYDRLGTGKSSVVSGYVAQIRNQIAILESLTASVKAGNYTGSIGVPTKLVLVGHSFGSALSSAVVSTEPAVADGLILTGFNYNASVENLIGTAEVLQPRIANMACPRKFSKLDTGYLLPVDIYAFVVGFFKKPDYAVDVVEYADETGSPFAITEFLALSYLDSTPDNYTGPTMLISGQKDFIYCTGNCDGALSEPAAEIFSKAKAFEAVSYPGAGHALNLAYNATGAYDIITTFLKKNSL